MKKGFVFTCLILLCFMLGACGSLNEAKPNLDKGYSFNAEIVYNNTSVKGKFTRISGGVWEGVLTEPFAMQGINMHYDRGSVSFGLGDLSASFDSADGNLPLKQLLDAAENAFTGGYANFKSDKKGFELKGGYDKNEYVLVMSKAGNIPVSLEIPKLGLSALFTEAVTTELKPYDPTYFEDEIIDNSDLY